MSRIEILGEAEAEGFVVYGIREKATGKFGYVGQTRSFAKRVRSHVRKGHRGSRTKQVYFWMHGILTNGGTLEFILLEKCADEEASLAREMEWVGRLAAGGHRLTMVDTSGDYQVGPARYCRLREPLTSALVLSPVHPYHRRQGERFL